MLRGSYWDDWDADDDDDVTVFVIEWFDTRLGSCYIAGGLDTGLLNAVGINLRLRKHS